MRRRGLLLLWVQLVAGISGEHRSSDPQYTEHERCYMLLTSPRPLESYLGPILT